ncbi:hypothetical protein WJX81_008633 [Elliptochloris bilobata]|uniref:Major facilitator superfamily (MFS) profile domain-containing protein n=1 Tax=Elliptochloris bilobata TaxID=381761 RepID=A0AAW1RP96_9CHLO
MLHQRHQKGAEAEQALVTFFAVAMALASMQRATIAILAVPLQALLGLTMPQLGVLQAAVLVGYVAGQVPLGFLADRVGGPPVMLASLVAWSAVAAVTPLVGAARPAARLPLLVGARAALGLCQSCLMPATSAMAAQWVPEGRRAHALATVYAGYSLGTVAGLLLTPALEAAFRWPAALHTFSVAGLAWSAWHWKRLPPGCLTTAPRPAAGALEQGDHAMDVLAADPDVWTASGQRQRTPVQVLLLCWTHAVIGFGFFALQFWTPMILAERGVGDLRVLGLASAGPWAAAAALSVGAGRASDRLQAALGWPRLRARRLVQGAASMGPALCLLPLALDPRALSPAAAAACLTGAVASASLCYAGFHPYTLDVAPRDAGKLLGLTNSCATLAGIAANVLAGVLGARAGGFGAMLGLTAALYAASFATFAMFARGRPVVL